MNRPLLQGVRKSAGFVLILLGLLGLLIPFVQGWLLIFAGAFLINPKWAKSTKETMERFFRKNTDPQGRTRRGSERPSR